MTEYLCVIDYYLLYIINKYSVCGLPPWLSGKESARRAGDPGSIPGLGISHGKGNSNPLQCGNPCGQRSW